MNNYWILVIGIREYILTDEQAKAYKAAVKIKQPWVDLDGELYSTSFQSITPKWKAEFKKHIEESQWLCRHKNWHDSEITSANCVYKEPSCEKADFYKNFNNLLEGRTHAALEDGKE